MPLIKVIGPYEFRFYSRGELNEPPHIHVRSGRLEAKFWLTPMVHLARAGRFRLHELNEIAQLVEENQQEFLDAWNEYFE
jgi:hypothetical protein